MKRVLGYGVVLAMIISYTHTKSVLWTLWDSLFSWIYVLVSVFKY